MCEVRRLSGRSPATFLQCFAGGRVGGWLTCFDQSTEQFVAPLVGRETVSAHHQDLVVVVYQCGNRYRLHVNDVMLEPSSVGRLNIDERQANPLAVVNSALAEPFCPVRVGLRGAGHGR